MGCTRPLHGFRSVDGSIRPKESQSTLYAQTVPCGRCMDCRLSAARAWAIRCIHEAQMHEDNSFLTLTYDQEHLPEDGSLQLEHFQKFMHDLRQAIYPKLIRFFHCGEYGKLQLGDEQFLGRPHYHALIFGHSFREDRYAWKQRRGNQTFRSPQLEKLWPRGFSEIGEVTLQSAGYVARYITKKVTGEDEGAHYWSAPDPNGETWPVKPEYVTMSRRPGIGFPWFKRYWRDLYPSDFVVIEGKKWPVPRYYDKLLEQLEPEVWQEVQRQRWKREAEKPLEETFQDRLRVKEEVTEHRAGRLLRKMETGDDS